MSLGSKKEVTDKQFSGSCAKVSHKRQIAAFLFAFFIFMITLIFAGYDLMTSKDTLSYQPMPDSIKIDSPKGRILVILIDSLQKDAAFSDHMPFLSQYRERGVWGISEVVSTPLSIAGDQAIFAGIMASPFALVNDFHPGTATYDNIFKRMSLHGKRVALFGSLISGAYGAYTDLNVYRPHSFSFSEYEKAARDIFQQAYPFLKMNTWDFAVVQFVSLDHVGHLKTPASKEYLKALLLFDDYVKKLVALTTDEDIILITSEHGMDHRGFHTDRKPLVIETPFILVGKPIEKGGPHKILQIDWAPTLSLLAGVSPFYPSLALPALDLIKVSDRQHSLFLKEFSQAYTGFPDITTLEKLRQERHAIMSRKPPFQITLLIIIATVGSAILLAYVALFRNDRKLSLAEAISIPSGVLMIALVAVIAYHFGIPDEISLQVPFSANFMMTHPILTILIFSSAATISKFLFWILGRIKISPEGCPVLFFFTLVFVFVFLAANPYHPLNWVVLSIPVIGFVIADRHRTAWGIIFLSLWTGLAIRRLTFYNAYSAVDLPDRWLLATAMMFLALLFSYHRLRYSSGKMRNIVLGLACFIPIIPVIACPISVEWRTLFLSCQLLVIFMIIKEQQARETWMALWLVFFYLGTSVSLENTVHIIAFPLLLAACTVAQGTSPVAKGIIVGFLLWALFLLPGNAFELKLQDVVDPYLLGSAVDEKIIWTVVIIAGRYILPAALLIWGVTYRDTWASRLSTLATALLPVVFGIGSSYTVMMLTPSVGIPWEGFGRLTVLSCYFVVMICAFLLASAAVKCDELLRQRSGIIVERRPVRY